MLACVVYNSIMGILQRVAVCYYAVALMEIFLPRATHAQPATASGGIFLQEMSYSLLHHRLSHTAIGVCLSVILCSLL